MDWLALWKTIVHYGKPLLFSMIGMTIISSPIAILTYMYGNIVINIIFVSILIILLTSLAIDTGRSVKKTYKEYRDKREK